MLRLTGNGLRAGSVALDVQQCCAEADAGKDPAHAASRDVAGLLLSASDDVALVPG